MLRCTASSDMAAGRRQTWARALLPTQSEHNPGVVAPQLLVGYVHAGLQRLRRHTGFNPVEDTAILLVLLRVTNSQCVVQHRILTYEAAYRLVHRDGELGTQLLEDLRALLVCASLGTFAPDLNQQGLRELPPRKSAARSIGMPPAYKPGAQHHVHVVDHFDLDSLSDPKVVLPHPVLVEKLPIQLLCCITETQRLNELRLIINGRKHFESIVGRRG
mmetsp:Transcript_32707/g.84807  ORF Transcript_32707/g.84807 Transcript_32707/m.84807 type:complete len:217 (+) Transcript_32707:306-956(+)